MTKYQISLCQWSQMSVLRLLHFSFLIILELPNNTCFVVTDAGPAGSKADHCKTLHPSDVYNFDEDSSDALSPQHPASQESPCSTLASPQECGGTEVTYISPNLSTPSQVHQCLEAVITFPLINIFSSQTGLPELSSVKMCIL